MISLKPRRFRSPSFADEVPPFIVAPDGSTIDNPEYATAPYEEVFLFHPRQKKSKRLPKWTNRNLP